MVLCVFFGRFLKNITIFASFHVLGMRRSVMHFVYSLASCLAIVSYPAFAFNVSMLTRRAESQSSLTPKKK